MRRMVCIILFINTFLVLVSAYSGCPGHLQLHPCYCMDRPSGNMLICARLAPPNDHQRAINGSNGWTFSTLLINNSVLKHVYSSSLVRNKLKSIWIANSNMSTLFDTQPSDANFIETLYINDVSFKDGLDWSHFRALPFLEYFNLQYATLPVLSDEIVGNFHTELKHFLLSNTKTQRLGDRVFENFTNLVEIKIRNAHISEMLRTMFPTPANLIKLDFTRNQIDSFHSDIFTDMPKLKILLLGFNRITHLHHDVFNPIYSNLNVLDLSGNPLTCSCHLLWLLTNDSPVGNAICVRPEDKYGMTLRSLRRENFTNCNDESDLVL